MVKKRSRRLQVEISADLERKLILWAATRDMKLNPWVKVVLRMRVEEHWIKIHQTLKEKAERLELSVEELEHKILEQYGFDFEREREELEHGLPDGEDD
jgi:predicted HicB family RNase H-like nuclease